MPRVIPPTQEAPTCAFCGRKAFRLYHGKYGSYFSCWRKSCRTSAKAAAGLIVQQWARK